MNGSDFNRQLVKSGRIIDLMRPLVSALNKNGFYYPFVLICTTGPQRA